MFGFFERLLAPTDLPPGDPPPEGLTAFYWHYIRQVKGLTAAFFVVGSVAAVLDLLIPIFLGRVVSLVTSHSPQNILADHWPVFAGMAIVLLVARPLVLLLRNLITNQALAGLVNLVRWQNHWHVVRQSWTFFQNDFAGRVANRVMQTGASLRESVLLTISSAWYIVIYGGSAMAVLAGADLRLALPIVGWFIAYLFFLRYFVPRLRTLSHASSEVRSNLTGCVVDSYTNILTVKLFARSRDEDAYVRGAVDEHMLAFRRLTRLMTAFSVTLLVIDAALIVAMGAVSLWLWAIGRTDVGIVAMALPLAWQITNMSFWVASSITAIFDNVGAVQDGMKSIAVAHSMVDSPAASELRVDKGHVRFENVHFGYGTSRGVLKGIDLSIAPGERIGLVGPSGSGKSTMVNVLLRFFDIESGRILIDGQDIATVTQESLRANIAMVTQDTSLLHRSIRDNICYGRPDASDDEIRQAAARAHALDFIETLEDWHGRRGFDAQVGERGVKLSGGQRQRIALARVILKNAPILVLDEATSALDSEVEAAIQEQLGTLMQGRTVIAIAHRLSTIARMDRLLVMEEGRIVEMGSHDELLKHNGVYARLWHRQSGGFQTSEAEVSVSERI